MPANVNQAVAVVTLDEKKIIPAFVFEQVLSKSIQRILTGKIVEAAGANLSLKNVGDLEILFPLIETRKKFCEVQNNLSQTIQKQNKDLIIMENLFQSLQQRAFKGELFSDDFAPADEPREENAGRQASLF